MIAVRAPLKSGPVWRATDWPPGTLRPGLESQVVVVGKDPVVNSIL